MDTSTDDFLRDVDADNSLGDKIVEAKSDNVVVALSNPIKETKSNQDEEETTNSRPDLVGDDFPPDYIKIVNRIKVQYGLLPSLDYDAIYKEMSDLSVKSCPTPSLEVLNDELHKVQAAKDRLSEILIDVIKCYNFKKRAVDILKDSWGKFTLEKNTEGRKGDATFRLSHFLTDFSRTEALSKSCDHVLKNLDSLQDNLSRRITIWHLLLKLREGRMSLPDHDFDKETDTSKIDQLFSDNKEENKNEESEIKLREF